MLLIQHHASKSKAPSRRLRSTAALAVAALLCARCQTCWAIAPPYVSDAELVDKPTIVVAHWDKTRVASHVHTRDEPGIGKVIDRFEAVTELVVERVIKGDLAVGRHKLLIGYGVGWNKDGREVRTYTSTDIPGDVDDVTKPTIWFLSAGHSWDEADSTTYLQLDTYRGIQPLALEAYYRLLMRPDRDQAIADILDSADKRVVRRTLRFIHGERDPWPFDSMLEEFLQRSRPKAKQLVQHAPRIADTLNRMEPSLRPYAVAVYASLAGEQSVGKMRELLADKDPVVRAIAVGILASHHDKTSMGRFSLALSNALDAYVACAVIERMDAWGDVRLVPALISFLQDDSDAGAINDVVPALKAKRALLRITGYAFPYDVKASLAAWETARQIADPAQRKRYLIHRLGGGTAPIRAHLVRNQRTELVVANVSNRTVDLERKPDWIDVWSEGWSAGFMPRDPSNPISFVSLRPGESIRFPLTLDETFLISPPSSRKILLIYRQSGNRRGFHAWIGTLPATIGPGFKEPRRVILHVVQRYPNGAVRAEGWTINGKRNGKWTFFRVDGRKTKEVQYVYGQEHGAAYFDPDYAGKE